MTNSYHYLFPKPMLKNTVEALIDHHNAKLATSSYVKPRKVASVASVQRWSLKRKSMIHSKTTTGIMVKWSSNIGCFLTVTREGRTTHKARAIKYHARR